MSDLFGAPLSVINVGLAQFAGPIRAAGADVAEVEWAPPAHDEGIARALARLINRADIETANQTAFGRYLAAQPTLRGVGVARDVLDGLGERMILHSGPPISWDEMCAPVRGAIAGACVYEGWAKTPEDAEILAGSGEISFAPCHHFGAVGPMAGIISPSMPLWIIEDPVHDHTTFSSGGGGLGKVLRFGANAPDVITHLEWMRDVLAPALVKTLDRLGDLELKPIMAQALHMGDEVHNRNGAASALLIKRLIPAALDAGLDSKTLSDVVSFINSNDHFFLNLSMAACKSMLDAAHGVPGSSLVTAMARNGVNFGIRVSGLGDNWFEAPAAIIDGLFFPGYSTADANPDLGDSSITESAGIGAFAMAASPAIVQFVGGTASDALSNTRRMGHITFGRNTAFTLPALDFMATPAGIDIRKVVDTGIAPVINTGIAHREAGIGQVGAGITHAPLACFSAAVAALAETYVD